MSCIARELQRRTDVSKSVIVSPRGFGEASRTERVISVSRLVSAAHASRSTAATASARRQASPKLDAAFPVTSAHISS